MAADVEAVARLFRLVRTTSLHWLPELHSPAEDLAFFRDHVFAACEVHLAVADAPLGFCAFRPGWVDHLYVHPDHHSQRIGTTLLHRAMRTRAHLQLWAFQRNIAALEFYQRRGFHIVELTDGQGNEEKEPDALLEWHRPPFPTA